MITRECYSCGEIFTMEQNDLLGGDLLIGDYDDIAIWLCPTCKQEEMLDEANSSEIDP